MLQGVSPFSSCTVSRIRFGIFVYGDFATIYFTFKARVIADGGTFEAGDCLFDNLVYLYRTPIGNSSAFDFFTLILTANAYKANVMYAVKPNTSAGDFPFTRALAAYRTDSDGLFELMATGVPRLDYTSNYGDCPVWLFEPARTNLLLHSNNFTNAVWVKTIFGTGVLPVVTTAAGIAPDGNNTANRVVFDAGGTASSTNFSMLRQSVSGLSNPHNSVISLWVKSYDGNPYTILFYNEGLASSADYRVVSVTNEWQKVELYKNVTATVDRMQFGLFQIGSDVSSAFADLLVWEGQLEVAVKATSNVNTTTLAVLRPADVTTRTDLQSGGFLGATSGAFYIDYENTSQTEASTSKEIEVSGGGAVDAIQLQASVLSGSVYPLTYRKVIGGVATTLFTPSYSPANIRALFVYDATTLSIWMNGTLVVDSVDFTRANNALDTFDILGGGLYRKAIRLLDFSDLTPTDAQAQGLTGFSTLNDYLSFIGYASDDAALYADYL